MNRFYLFGFALLMGFDTLSQICFKYAGIHALPVQADVTWLTRLFTQPWVYGAVIGYLGAFLVWMALLKRAPIGPAFAASHLEVVSVLLLSVPLFGEHIGPVQGLGAVAIVAGIVCLALGERDAPAQ
ncbi:MAG: EamA family transporter [Rhodanobacteraceae bacterium]